MPRTLSLASFALFTALIVGSAAAKHNEIAPPASESIETTHAAAHPSCAPGAIWAGDKCRMQRTIVLEDTTPTPPPPPPPPPPSALSIDWWLALIS